MCYFDVQPTIEYTIGHEGDDSEDEVNDTHNEDGVAGRVTDHSTIALLMNTYT